MTFKLATGNDWWFHAKQIPGSHVIVRATGNDNTELPDNIYEIAGSLVPITQKAENRKKLKLTIHKRNI